MNQQLDKVAVTLRRLKKVTGNFQKGVSQKDDLKCEVFKIAKRRVKTNLRIIQ